MARIAFPYPPSPPDVPDDLTDPPAESTAAIMAVLAGLFLFLMAYFGTMMVCAAVLILTATKSLTGLVLIDLGLCVVAVIVGLILLLGIFNRDEVNPEITFELDPDEQPMFFAFLRRITTEIGAPMPDRVFLVPEVNAAMSQNVSLINLFVPPKKNLVVGLGLVNALNLSEFKAVVGHEFGHFSQKTSRMTAYVALARRVMVNLVVGQDWLERSLQSAKAHTRRGQDASVMFAWGYLVVVGGPVWGVRFLMNQVLKLLTLAYLSMSRANEFHADRIAVSVAGSNAIVHALARLDFASESLGQAVKELDTATQHKLYTDDLYHHQTAAMGYLRRTKKKPRLGLPPELAAPHEGEDVRVFREDDDENDNTPEMWKSHPSNYDREANAKEQFVPADPDERSPWGLFSDAEILRERMTYRFYRVAFRVKKTVNLSPAAKVQGFIDDEHAEMTYDPKYAGCYDERPLYLGDFDDLEKLAKDEDWDAERITRVHSRLYGKLERKVDDFYDIRRDIRKLMRQTFGKPKGRDRRRMDELEDDFKDVIDWFTSFDRRVYLVHAQMAKQLGITWEKELVHRYDFHIRLQEIHRKIAFTQERVEDILEGLNHFKDNIPPWFFEDLMETLKEGRRGLKKCLQQAEEMTTPAMANVEKGTNFDALIFEGELLREIPETFVTGKWIDKLLKQLGMTRQRILRMDFKSLGAILLMQDKMHAAWLAKVTPAAVSGETPAVVAPLIAVPPPIPRRRNDQ